MGHDFLSMYSAKSVEYLLGLGFLGAFIVFWRLLQGGRQAAQVVLAAARDRRPMTEGFQVPDGLHFHPGHLWARVDGPGLVTVGLDDFARRLVGPVAVGLPDVGTALGQGEPAFLLGAGDQSVPALSPIDGTVVARNERLPAAADADPYGDGWLCRVRAPRLEANLKNLLSGPRARRWMEGEALALRGRADGELGQLLQDGGVPIHGIAHALDPAHWDEIARGYLLS